MKHLQEYAEYVNESKDNSLSLFKKDIKNILNGFFAKAKKPIFHNNKYDGFPIFVEFEVTDKDYNVDYDKDEEFRNEFSPGVIQKREFEPVFKFYKKEERGSENNPTYILQFTIDKKELDQTEKPEEKPRRLDFDKDTDEQLLKKLKSGKYSYDQNIEIQEILDERGINWSKELEDEDEDEDLDPEMKKLKSKDNEKILNYLNYLATLYNITFRSIKEEKDKWNEIIKDLGNKTEDKKFIKDYFKKHFKIK